MTRPLLFISADHAGFERKEWLKQFLAEHGYEVTDLGPATHEPDDDYPGYGFALGEAVAKDQAAKGIAFCGNGQGICIAANKVAGVRAVSAFTPEMAVSTRNNDDANVLCLPARFQTNEEIGAIVLAWLETPFSAETRHERRVGQLEARS